MSSQAPAIAETDAARASWLEAGRVLFSREITFVRGVTSLQNLPPSGLPEVAFAGRSNVGKSSLINALTGRKSLARASSEPGRTRELNYFLLDQRAHLVDLPGYGYAKAPKTEIARWTILTRDFLRGRPGLSRVFLLIDGRHGLKDTDRDVMGVLDQSAVVYQIVLTKADGVKVAQLQETITQTAAAIVRRPAAHPVVLAVSAHEGDGLDQLRAEIAVLAGFSLNDPA